MSRYDGLIIPRSYSEYINKTDAATLLQALQLSGVMDNAPIVNSNHPVKSGGIYNEIRLKLEKKVQLAPGANTVNLDTNGGYLLLVYGSNYAQAACLITQGYSTAVLKNTLIANNINFGQTDYTASKTLTVTNNSVGTVELKVLRIT